VRQAALGTPQRAAGGLRVRVGAVTAVLALLATLCACGRSATAAVVQEVAAPVIHPGQGVFTFDGYPPLADRPVRVYYDAPPDPSTAQILVVMHGVGRNASDYRDDWVPLVRGRNVLVLAPEFSEKNFPGHESYSLGNMTEQDRPQAPRLWTFQIIEALFDSVVRDVHSSAHDYAMFGHSAGAQFVHRFIEFMPGNRARIAVAANPGWYTMPDDAVPFPYGLDGAPVHTADLGPAFASNLILMLGGDDTDSDDESLRHDEQADQQGRYRLERGRNFFHLAEQVASRASLPFHWQLRLVPGVAHDHRDMATAAAPLLIPVEH